MGVGDGFHVTPSVEIRMVLELPTAMNSLPVQVISFRLLTVPEVRGVQVVPSPELRIVPEAPTATSRGSELDQATPLRLEAVPEVREVHAIASGDVSTVPLAPTATCWAPVQTRSLKLDREIGVQLTPSVEE